MLVHLILSQRSLRLSSVLFILFTLFCSSEVISTILSSSSLSHSSAPDILLLISFRVFLISISVLFFSVCLFFKSSKSLLIDSWYFLHFVFKVFDHLYYPYSEFFPRLFAYFLFIYLDSCVPSLFLHLCSISVPFHFFDLLSLRSCCPRLQGRLNSFLKEI